MFRWVGGLGGHYSVSEGLRILENGKLTESYLDSDPINGGAACHPSHPASSHCLLPGTRIPSLGHTLQRLLTVHPVTAHIRTCRSALIPQVAMQLTYSMVPTILRRAFCTSWLRGLRRVLISIGICDHCSEENGGVRDGSGIQWRDETSV